MSAENEFEKRSLGALSAFASARNAADAWRPNVELVNVMSAQMLSRQVGSRIARGAIGYMVITSLSTSEEIKQLDPTKAYENSFVNIDPWVMLPTPFVLVWQFVFKLTDDYLSVLISTAGVRQWSHTFSPDAGFGLPIVGWKVDSTDAIERARAAGGREGGQNVSLAMWRVDDDIVPLWLVPFGIDNGDKLSIRADTGEVVKVRLRVRKPI